MDLATLARMGLGAARYRTTGHRTPLTVWLALTNRCESLCATCASPLRGGRELSTAEWLAVVDAVAERGCQALVLTGGEPLVRDDLPEILVRAREHGLWIRLETSGHGFVARASQLGFIDHLVVSLDGDEAAHEANREPGSWGHAMAALEESVRRGLVTTSATVITRHNVHRLDAILDLADDHGFSCTFRLLHHHDAIDGDTTHLAPSEPDLRRALRSLLEARRRGRPVAMAEKTLRTLVGWEDYGAPTSEHPREDQLCLAGQTHCFVDADGTVHPCRRTVGRSRARNVRTHGFDAAFELLRPGACQACAVADLTELNHVHNLNLPTLLGWVVTRRHLYDRTG